MNDYFEISARGSNVRTEVLGGLTSFATMSYIVFVQPTVMSFAGMPFGSALLATFFSSALSFFLMGTLALYPFALAPGMVANFFFAFAVCGSMGFEWQAGLALVFIAGLIFLALSTVRARERFMEVLPDCLKYSIGPAIGLFIAFIGLQWGGIVVLSPATMVSLADLTHPIPLITVGSVLLMAALIARGIRLGILIGIVFATAALHLTGQTGGESTSAEFTFETFFALNVSQLIERWPDALVAIALFFFLDFFDTVGTLLGVSRLGNFLRVDGTLPRANQAFLSDAAGTCAGALFGMSTVTTYIESSTGIAAGAKAGLAAIVTGLCFLGAIALVPVARLTGFNAGPAYYADLGVEGALINMFPAVAPAMIVVGILMMPPLAHIQWKKPTDAIPAFLTLTMMAFGFGITEGIALGIISFAVLKPLTGERKAVHPILYVVAVSLLLRYAFLM